MQPWHLGALLAAALALGGCDKSSPSSQPADGPPAAAKGEAAGPKKYEASDLPAVAEPLPPLDGGRVEIAPPKGWRVLPRDSKFLARFVKGKEDNDLPRITVSAMAAPEGIADVTEATVAEFAAQMQKRSDAVPGRRMLEPERPILLGENAWSRHVRHLKASNGHAPLQSLATARAGRLYLIELTVAAKGDSTSDFAKAILAHRDAAYAVATSWRFLGEAAEPPTETPAGEKAEGNKPKEENPPPADKPAAAKVE